jgi:hypothetical protein
MQPMASRTFRAQAQHADGQAGIAAVVLAEKHAENAEDGGCGESEPQYAKESQDYIREGVEAGGHDAVGHERHLPQQDQGNAGTQNGAEHD